MKVTTKHASDTQAVVSVIADDQELATIKSHVIKQLAPQVKVPGFRAGKVPAELVEKNIDPKTFQVEFLEHAVNDLYPAAVREAALRPVGQPQIDLKKFVPFSTLEFEAKVEVIGQVTLGDYKKLKKAKPTVKVTDKDIDEVIGQLLRRAATKKAVERAAKKNDEVVIDFKGVDEKGEPVKGADAVDYPLLLGSNTFIPGFEENVIGMKPGEEKTFTLAFPKDYGVKALANRKVTFTATVKKVSELEEPKLDDAFAATLGPVKTVKELREDIKRELKLERQRQTDRDYESAIVKELTDTSKVAIPRALVEDTVERMLRDLQQNLLYRGQTLPEFLETEGKSEEEYRNDILEPEATERVKASLVIAELADRENVEITREELDARISELKAQYKDPKMQEELNKPEARQEIASRLMSEKTVAHLVAIVSA